MEHATLDRADCGVAVPELAAQVPEPGLSTGVTDA